MLAPYLAVFEAAVREYSTQKPRIVAIHDGDPLLQLTGDRGITRMPLNGRPDGIRPQGFPTILHQLQSYTAASAPTVHRPIPPQAWMELEREFVLYQDRARAALAASVNYVRQQEPRIALDLCAVVLLDLTALNETMDFAARFHPRQTLSATPPPNRVRLIVDHTVATLLHNVLCEDSGAARECVIAARRRIDECKQRWHDHPGIADATQAATRLCEAFTEQLTGAPAGAQSSPAALAVTGT